VAHFTDSQQKNRGDLGQPSSRRSKPACARSSARRNLRIVCICRFQWLPLSKHCPPDGPSKNQSEEAEFVTQVAIRDPILRHKPLTSLLTWARTPASSALGGRPCRRSKAGSTGNSRWNYSSSRKITVGCGDRLLRIAFAAATAFRSTKTSAACLRNIECLAAFPGRIVRRTFRAFEQGVTQNCLEKRRTTE